MIPDIDVLIPARRGSVGLPGKNMRVLVDRSLVLHSIACAQRLLGVRHILVSTDDPLVADVAREAGAYVPSLRPNALATGDTPMADVVRHGLGLLDVSEGQSTSYLLLLDPTSPLRVPKLIDQAVNLLRSAPDAAGCVSISVPSFNPLWVGVELRGDGKIQRHPCNSQVFTRRQEVPRYWRINGNFYVWRNEFARGLEGDWLDKGEFLGFEIPEVLGHSIDTMEDWRIVETLVESSVVSLPWLEGR